MAEYVLIENGIIKEYHDLLPRSWRNVSGLNLLRDDIPALIAFGWYPVEKQTVTYDQNTQRVVRFEYIINELSVTEIPVIEDIPSELIPSLQSKKTALAETLRIERNYMLTQCDWTQLPDSPLSEEKKEEYKQYRQRLRDLPTLCDRLDITEFQNIPWPGVPL